MNAAVPAAPGATVESAAAVAPAAVAATGSDINMTNGLVVAAGDTVSCSALTYTALPA